MGRGGGRRARPSAPGNIERRPGQVEELRVGGGPGGRVLDPTVDHHEDVPGERLDGVLAVRLTVVVGALRAVRVPHGEHQLYREDR